MDFFDGVDGFFAPSVTIFCVVCRKGVSKIKFTTMMMVKQKRGRERQQASERERERERRSARVSSVAFKRLSRPFWLFSEHRPHRKEREREKTEREREEGSDFVLSSAFSRMISKMFNDTNPEKWKQSLRVSYRPSGNLVRPGVVDPVRARAFRSTFHH